MKNILLLGENGFVGNVVLQILQADSNLFFLPEKTKIDSDSIKDVIQNIRAIISNNKVDVVVNCIAKANLDECESEKESCRLINTTFVKQLVELMLECKDVKLVHVSSNAVYDGEHAPYSEESPCYPINYYGQCKLESDEYIADNLENYAIARPITVYGPKKEGQRDNPVSFIVRKLMDGDSLTLVDDNIVNMIHVSDLSAAIKKLALENHRGLYNLSGDVSECRYDLGLRVAKLIGVSEDKITKVAGKSFKMAAPRPKDTSFDNSKMKALLGIKPENIDKKILEVVSCGEY
ncbi:TPA: NAD(P)-dependent oxidoreductase [Vibrio metoecus]